MRSPVRLSDVGSGSQPFFEEKTEQGRRSACELHQYEMARLEINRNLRFHIIWDPVAENVSIKDKNAIIVSAKFDKCVYTFETPEQGRVKGRKMDKAVEETVNHVNKRQMIYQVGVWKKLKHNPHGIIVNTSVLHQSVIDRISSNFQSKFGVDLPKDDERFKQYLAFCFLVEKLLQHYYSVAAGQVPFNQENEKPFVTVIFHDSYCAPALVSLRQNCFVDEMCCVYAVYKSFLPETIPTSPMYVEEIAIEQGVQHIMKVEQQAVQLADRVCSFSDVPDQVLQRLFLKPFNLQVSEKDKAKRRVRI